MVSCWRIGTRAKLRAGQFESSRSRNGLAMWKPRSPDWRVPKNSPGRGGGDRFRDFETVGGAHQGSRRARATSVFGGR